MRISPLAAVSLLAALHGLSACDAPSALEDAPPSVLVSTKMPQRGSITDTVVAYGSAVPAANGGTTLSMQIEGRVLKLLVRPGEAVRAGQPLLDFQLSAAARSTYDQAVTTVKLAREERDRIARLLAQQLATRDQLARAEKALTDAEAALSALEKEYGDRPRRTITAPFDGFVSGIPVAQGARVAPGTALMTLTRSDGLVVTAGIEPAQRNRLRLQQTAQLESLVRSGEMLSGKLVRIDQALNPATRLIDADVAVSGALVQGEAFRVAIEVGRIEGWVVPHDAALADDRGAYVFQVVGNKAQRVTVKVLGRDGDTAVIEGSIDPQQPLVTEGNYQLTDGMPVRRRGRS